MWRTAAWFGLCVHLAFAVQLTAQTTAPTTQPALPRGAVMRYGQSVFTAGTWPGQELSYSPDGRRIVSTGASSFRLWSAVTGQPLTSTRDRNNSGSHVAFLDDNTLVVHRGVATLDICDAGSGNVLRSIDTKAQRIHHMFVAPGGRCIAIPSGPVTLWNPQTGERIAELGDNGVIPQNDTRRPICFSQDGKALLTIDTGGKVAMWDSATGRSIALPDLPMDPLYSGMSLSADGKTLALTGEKTCLFNLATGEQIATLGETLAGKQSRYLRFAPTGNALAEMHQLKMTVWDTSTRKAMYTIAEVRNVAWAPDATKLAVRHPYSTDILDAGSGKPLFEHRGHTMPVNVIAISPDESAMTSIDSSGTLFQWHFATPNPLPTTVRSAQGAPRAMRYSPDGRELIVDQVAQRFRFDATTLASTGSISFARPRVQGISSSTLTRDAQPQVRVDTTRYEITLYHPPAESPHAVIRVDPQHIIVFSAVCSTDGKLLGYLRDNHLYVCSTEDGRQISAIQLSDKPSVVGRVVWSNGDRHVMVAGNSEFWLCDPQAGVVLHRYDVPEVTDDAASADGMFLAVADGNAIVLIDPDDGLPITRIGTGNVNVTSLQFDHNSRRLLAGMDDGTILEFDLRRVFSNSARDSATPAELWRAMEAVSKSAAFEAAVALGKRPDDFYKLLQDHRPAVVKGYGSWSALIDKLSSKVPAEREQAQRELERGGADAAAAVAIALTLPPPGEAGERLTSLARVLGVDTKVRPTTRRANNQRYMPLDRQVVLALEWLGDDRAIAKLRELADQRSAVAAAAVQRLSPSPAAPSEP